MRSPVLFKPVLNRFRPELLVVIVAAAGSVPPRHVMNVAECVDKEQVGVARQ
jgi:hypothetical protein